MVPAGSTSHSEPWSATLGVARVHAARTTPAEAQLSGVRVRRTTLSALKAWDLPCGKSQGSINREAQGHGAAFVGARCRAERQPCQA